MSKDARHARTAAAGFSLYTPALLLALLAAGSLAFPRSAGAWCYAMQEPAPTAARALVLDVSGNVVVAGEAGIPSTARLWPILHAVRLTGDVGTETWNRIPNDDDFLSAQAAEVVTDSTGDVVVAGHDIHWILNWPAPGGVIETGRAFSVTKMSGANGDTLWRYAVDPSGDYGYASSATADGNDDIVASGALLQVGTDYDFTVAKLAGATGAEVWRYVLDGTASGADQSNDVAVDAFGDVLAAGEVENAGSASDFTVVKLSGSAGTESWRASIDGSASGAEAASTVLVDPAGDVIAAGSLNNGATGADFAVVKLSGATGGELWRSAIDGGASGDDDALAATLDPSGDVVACGVLAESGDPGNFAVAKFSGTDGTELWRWTLAGSAGGSDRCRSVSLDASGDVVAAGSLINAETGGDFVVVKLSGSTGGTIWTQQIDGLGHADDEAYSVVVDGSGDVVAAGTLTGTESAEEFTAVKLSGASGDWLKGRCPLPRFGHRLVVTDHALDPTKRRVVLVQRDSQITAPPAGSEEDPTSAGATLFIGNPTTREAVALPLPASGWEAKGSPPGSRGYQYRSGKGAGLPCKSARIVPGKKLSVKCSGKYGPIGFTLDEARQLTLTAGVLFGAADYEQCAWFDAEDVRHDYGTNQPKPKGAFRAKQGWARRKPCVEP
ncbi:MAG: hypothetical protein D6760_06680 [Deltaproteobacteria bacterium]|nr:MAG: hypothetical protein D6760_06680 [Deltaproteobacteria bacterium]